MSLLIIIPSDPHRELAPPIPATLVAVGLEALRPKGEHFYHGTQQVPLNYCLWWPPGCLTSCQGREQQADDGPAPRQVQVGLLLHNQADMNSLTPGLYAWALPGTPVPNLGGK